MARAVVEADGLVIIILDNDKESQTSESASEYVESVSLSWW